MYVYAYVCVIVCMRACHDCGSIDCFNEKCEDVWAVTAGGACSCVKGKGVARSSVCKGSGCPATARSLGCSDHS